MSTTLKRLADLALTIGAVVGVGCLLVVVAGPLLGVSAQFVRSGSMEPDFGTGALVFAREASVSDLTEGDVVSIQTEGSRITHRIVEIHRDGDMATLTLQGDANRNPDTRTHTVSSADRVFLDVPWLGYPLGWLRAPLGMIILAGLAVVLLVRLLRGVWRERERKPARVGNPTAIVVAGVLSAGVIAALVVSRPTWGAWNDDVVVSGAVFTAAASPAAPGAPGGGACTGGGFDPLIIRWTSVGASYDYVIDIYRDGGQVGTINVGAATQQQLSASQNGITVNGDYTARVYAFLRGSPAWRSSSYLSVDFNRNVLWIFPYLTCG